MRHMWRLATRNWWASPLRTLASLLSVALGVAMIVLVGNAYATVRLAIEHEVTIHWLGASDLSIHPIGAHVDTLPDSLAQPMANWASAEHVSVRLKRKIYARGPLQEASSGRRLRVDAIGIDPGTASPFISFSNLSGRPLLPAESGKAVVERALADAMGVGLGDSFTLTDGADGVGSLDIVGLFDSNRVGAFQSPYAYLPLADLQSIVGQGGSVTSVEIILKPEARQDLDRAEAQLGRIIEERNLSHQCKIVTAKFRDTLLGEARRLTDLSLTLVAFVVMLSSFFVILTTMTISLFERTTSLGVMRCVGCTRRQMASMLFVELIPLGAAGTALGVVLGIGLTRWIGSMAQGFGGEMIVFPHGILLAMAAGALTTTTATLMLILKVTRVTPLAAIHPHATPPRTYLLYASGVFGVLLIGLHEWMIALPDQTRWLTMSFSGVAIVSLYTGYILLAPMLVVLPGPLVVRCAASLLGVRRQLAVDQFRKSPWRNTGVCWMLVVGLSLIVYISINSETILRIWNFADRLPEGFIWSDDYLATRDVKRALSHPAIIDPTYAVDVDCKIRIPQVERSSRSSSLFGSFLAGLTRPVFVGCDVRRLASMVQVAFAEGEYEDAVAKLDRGGYLLLPVQTATHHGAHLGDTVLVGINDREVPFEIAGVVEAPILDLTVTAMQASSYMQFAAANVLIGTQDDLKDRFDLDVVTMAMFDLRFPATQPPEAFQAEHAIDPIGLGPKIEKWMPKLPYHQEEFARIRADMHTADANALPNDLCSASATTFCKRVEASVRRAAWQWEQKTPEQRWYVFRERMLLKTLAERMDRPDATTGSLHRLKELGDRTIRNATAALTWLPSIILIVAAIGIANLMMVSVQIRARQIAMLRAVGALKSQILRMVLAEAVALGILGTLCGVALGVHLAATDNRVTAALTGVHADLALPFGQLAVQSLLTLIVCLTAGLLPALRAARNDIVTALHAF